MSNYQILNFYPDKRIPVYLFTDKSEYLGDLISKTNYSVTIGSDAEDLFNYLQGHYAQTKLGTSELPLVLVALKDSKIAMELCTSLREEKQYGRFQPICYYQNDCSVQTKSSALQTGYDLIVESPFCIDFFNAQVNSLLRRILVLNLKGKKKSTDFDQLT